MSSEVLRLDAIARRRSLIAFTAGIVVYALIIVVLYPTFKGSTSLDQFVHSDSTAAALFGVSGDLSSSGGWLNGNLFANFFPLVVLLATIGYGAAAFAGQDEDGTLCLLVTLPVSRRAIVLQKAAALAGQAVIISVGVAICVVAGRNFQLDTSVADATLTSVVVACLGFDFGLLAMLLGVVGGRRGTAIGWAAAVASASYLVSSLAPVVAWLRPARYASLFYWTVGHNQIVTGVTAGDAGVLLSTGLVLLTLTIVAFDRYDVRSG